MPIAIIQNGVQKIICGLDASKANGPDRTPTRILIYDQLSQKSPRIPLQQVNASQIGRMLMTRSYSKRVAKPILQTTAQCQLQDGWTHPTLCDHETSGEEWSISPSTTRLPFLRDATSPTHRIYSTVSRKEEAHRRCSTVSYHIGLVCIRWIKSWLKDIRHTVMRDGEKL